MINFVGIHHLTYIMPIGFGPGKEMVKAVNQQRAAKRKSKRSLKDSIDDLNPKGSSESAKLIFKNKATPEMLAEIRRKKSLERKKNLYMLVCACVVLFILAILIL